MNSVLGFEKGEINKTIAPTTISTTTAIVSDQIIITDLNKKNNFSYDGAIYNATYRSFTRTCSGIANNLSNYSLTKWNIPVIATYNAATHLYTFTNNTTNIPLVLLTLGGSAFLVS